MKLVERLISLYAPLQCLGCGTEGPILCDNCLEKLPAPASCCYRCGQPARYGRTCASCRMESCLVSANAAAVYDGLAKDLVWRLKFARTQAAAQPAAARMAALYGRLIANDVLIVPVPTADRRVRGRGYDQAVLLARELARQTGCRYAPLLQRLGSQEQIGAAKSQRRAQLAGAFRLKRPDRAREARILLIDDVLTSGATMEAAAALLRQAGARSVGALVFARPALRSVAARADN